MEGISKKIYLELEPPTEDDSRSAQVRILDALKEKDLVAVMSLQVMRKLHPLCESTGWKLTVSLAWDGENWKIVDLEAGDTSSAHYGLAVDLGSTTVVMRLLNCNTGEILVETSSYNRQIAYGMDILTRIFHSKDNPEALEEIRKATVESFLDNLKEIEERTGISSTQCIQMVVSGNTTMTHFLLGMDAFCVFYTPYAVRADQPGFILGRELEIPISGYVFCYPSKSNYLGGDIISGMVETELYKNDEICAFFDIGTNGELVLGNKEFLLCGAGAAGPALEGGVVKTGMRAASGAVDEVHIEDGKFKLHVIGEGEPIGICGSGIVDMIAQLFLNRWIDIRGTFQPEKSELIQKKDDSVAVEYAPGLFFYQEDIIEFIRTKAAAYTMVEIMFKESGFPMEELSKFYVAGAFGKHVSKESAITIGMYPDMDRERLVNAGNSSLEGAQKLLLHREILSEIDEILEKMVYIQYGAVEGFLEMMMAAQALPHTDMERYPTVKKHFDM
jgi:uncharacterized 2Fe-2S/4Fe-4S cluster protein (DUF4445 family)